ncbi:winged helix-turn-helix transcriptional regulator [Nocardia colli]|uniref:winged helix-turn-helix transcriptional regulator n=1 Tax=Nocardia colli TaxID=2545717 RepID=UPI0035D5EA59
MPTTDGRPEPRFHVDCPTRPILDQVADKWSMMALTVLEQPTRFNEIKRQLEGVTQRVLTQTLRRLERNGMVVRRVLETSPIGVEYSLTPLGESFRVPFTQLYEWTLEHSDEIERAQRAYDG